MAPTMQCPPLMSKRARAGSGDVEWSGGGGGAEGRGMQDSPLLQCFACCLLPELVVDEDGILGRVM